MSLLTPGILSTCFQLELALHWTRSSQGLTHLILLAAACVALGAAGLDGVTRVQGVGFSVFRLRAMEQRCYKVPFPARGWSAMRGQCRDTNLSLWDSSPRL